MTRCRRARDLGEDPAKTLESGELGLGFGGVWGVRVLGFGELGLGFGGVLGFWVLGLGFWVWCSGEALGP